MTETCVIVFPPTNVRRASRCREPAIATCMDCSSCVCGIHTVTARSAIDLKNIGYSKSVSHTDGDLCCECWRARVRKVDTP